MALPTSRSAPRSTSQPLALPTLAPRPSVLRRGLLAGAVGTTVLNTVTYGDMAWRGRDASSVPEATVDALADVLDRQIPGGRRQRANRRTALGALAGTATGLAVGVLASAARGAGLRFSPLTGAVVTGAAAMAASDLPIAALGVSDPRTWTAADWVSDALPHLAYGAAVHSTLSALDPAAVPVRRARLGLVVRAALLGVATGSRSSLGVSLPVLTSPLLTSPLQTSATGSALRPGPSRGARVAAAAAIGGELVGDKLPQTPSRLMPAALTGRFAAGVTGAGALARRETSNAVAPAVAAAAGVAAGAWGGFAWRRWASRLLPDWQAALIEDAAAVSLGLAACLPGRTRG